tara:strand:- start:1341 stop:6395 length:5055 start_codon:yes stop_codon:yes gene_type:complete
MDEFGKSIAKFGETLVEAPFSLYDAARYVMDSKIRTLGGEGLEELTEEDLEERRKLKAGISKGLTAPMLSALGVKEEDAFTEEGEVREAETIPGAVGQLAGEIGAYAVPFTGITRGARALGLGERVAAPIAGAAITEQLLTDPTENLFNIVEDTFPEASKNTFIEYMAADADDDEITNRMKMVIQDVGLIPLIERGVSFAATLKRMGQSKKYDQLSEEEQTEVLMSYLGDARKEAKRADIEARREGRVGVEREDLPAAREVTRETQEGIEQVAGQGNVLKRLARRFFTSEGYMTPQAYNAFRDTQYSQRQTIRAAENIGNRLNIALKKITDETSSKEMSDRVQEALQADASFIYEMPEQERVEFFRSQYRLSEEVANEVINARQLMDGLSKKIVGSKGFSADVKQSISANVGNYMRRSYRMFEDPAFKPSSEVRENAVQFLADDLLEATPDMDIDDALSKAESQVDKILSKADDAEVVDYLSQVRRVSTFKQKKDIPEPIRALLGEVTSPSESIILSVAKASRIYEVNNFYRQFNELGKTGGYLTAREGGRNTAKISGTNSILDGKYTTPEMLQALERKEEMFSSVMEGNNPLAVLLQNFATAKGFSQQMKTVGNHVTHIRNFLGGAQFSIANGMMPFTSSGLKSGRTLFNSLLNKGDQEFDEAYEKYLRLGVINTNVKVNEFRALLEAGMEREPSFITKQLEKIKYVEGVPGVRQVDTGVKAVFRGAEKAYMATDDFYKLNAFGNELATLKKAFPDVAEDVLEIKAAQIVQDTIPNYDKVPKGIKALRDMPVGNFVSFPAEIARTSIKIVKQASEEINSGNTVLRNRGLRRLSGFTATAIGFNEASKATMDALGWTEEEQRAHTDLAEGAFNKDSNKLWRMDEDGQLYFVDTRFLDSYEFIKRPVMIAVDRINEGALRGDDLDDALFEAAKDTAASLLEPFASQEMITEAMLNSGTKLYRGQIEVEDFVGDVLNTFVPGSVTSIQRYVEALNEEPNRYSGEPRNAQNELIANLTGVRFTKYDPDLNLQFAVRDYNRIEDSNRSQKFLYDTNPEEYISEYREQQQKIYEGQQDLFKITNAYVTLYGKKDAMKILRENGISRSKAASIVLGQFKGTNPRDEVLTVESFRAFKKIDPDTARKKSLQFRDSLSNVQSELNGSSLYTPDYKLDLDTDTYREGRAKGGEVLDVPNASKEPDQRIDKMTGMPYDQQAGTAFVDEEDPLRRLGFTGGGEVDPLQRLGFVAGSTVIAKGLRELFTPTKTVGSKGDKRVIQDPDKPVVMTQTEELEETLEPRMTRAMEAETASSVMPAPGKFFDPESRGYKGDKFVEGMTGAGIEVDLEFGNYIGMAGKPKDISNQTVQNLFVTARTAEKLSSGSNKSVARVNEYDGENLTLAQMKENYKKATGVKSPQTVRTNLLQPEKFRIIEDGKEGRLDNPIVAVEGRGSEHFYTLDTQFVGPVRMNRMTRKGKDGKVPQPNLRPETVGDIVLGDIIGTIKVGKKTHPLYDYIEVDGTPSLPEGVTKREKFNQGGFHMGYGSPEYSSFAEAQGYKYGSSTAEDIDTLERQVKQRYFTDRGIPLTKSEVKQQLKEEVLSRSGLPVTLSQRDAQDLIKERIASELSSRLPVDVGVQGDDYSLSKTFRGDEGSFLSLGASTNSGDPQFNLSFRKNFESGGKVLAALKRKKGV